MLWAQRKKNPWDLIVRQFQKQGGSWFGMGLGRKRLKRRRAWESHAEVQLWVKYALLSVNRRKNPWLLYQLSSLSGALEGHTLFPFPTCVCLHSPPEFWVQRKNGAWFHSWELVWVRAAPFVKRTGRSPVWIYYSASLGRPSGSHTVGGAWGVVWSFSSGWQGTSHDSSELTAKMDLIHWF